MAKSLIEVLKIQNEISKLSAERTSVDGDKLKSIEQRLEAYLKLQANGGRAPTKRDDAGNILLYEDPLQPGIQLQRADQFISVELIKPDYDDEQAKEVLNTQINELFTAEDTGQIARLQRQIEELRQQLRDATAPVFISGSEGTPSEGQTQGTGSMEDEMGLPSFAITLPDASGGSISTTPLLLDINTGIFDDTTMTLRNFNSANPFSINWWIIDSTTEEIYSQGVDNTYISSLNANGEFTDKDLDVVLQLTNTVPNFNGWWVNDQSTGDLTKYIKFSSETMVRFNFIPRYNVENSLIDQFRNTYYIIASFLNEAPNVSTKEPVDVNLDIAEIGANNVVSKIGNLGTTEIGIREIDSSNNVIQERAVTTPNSVIAYKGDRFTVTTRNERILFNNQTYIWVGWFVKSAFNNSYNLLTTSRSYAGNLTVGDEFNWVAGYKLEL